ncbi:hypothetical protein Thpro_021142 [Acidihalobacter prosperus]|uniref:Uncharacterized protein n=1 Tax=Acidihalobacter prosperus TaxID=160660 RepID=A0A1A6C6A0_9GAMM|nr:hypothetical protein Thpro_021142 [Acidihalobacter prosperus]
MDTRATLPDLDRQLTELREDAAGLTARGAWRPTKSDS